MFSDANFFIQRLQIQTMLIKVQPARGKSVTSLKSTQ